MLILSRTPRFLDWQSITEWIWTPPCLTLHTKSWWAKLQPSMICLESIRCVCAKSILPSNHPNPWLFLNSIGPCSRSEVSPRVWWRRWRHLLQKLYRHCKGEQKIMCSKWTVSSSSIYICITLCRSKSTLKSSGMGFISCLIYSSICTFFGIINQQNYQRLLAPRIPFHRRGHLSHHRDWLFYHSTVFWHRKGRGAQARWHWYSSYEW